MRELDRLAANWWEHHRLSQGTRRERKALELGQPEGASRAEDTVLAVVVAGGTPAIEILMALAHAAPDDDALLSLGAGLIEDLVAEHGERGAELLAAAARSDPVFARAVAGMWLPTSLSPRGVEILTRWVPDARGVVGEAASYRSGEASSDRSRLRKAGP